MSTYTTGWPLGYTPKVAEELATERPTQRSRQSTASRGDMKGWDLHRVELPNTPDRMRKPANVKR